MEQVMSDTLDGYNKGFVLEAELLTTSDMQMTWCLLQQPPCRNYRNST